MNMKNLQTGITLLADESLTYVEADKWSEFDPFIKNSHDNFKKKLEKTKRN